MSLPDLFPARMLNEYAYCPRLFYLEWVLGEWADSADTEEGRLRHRRVDEEKGALPDADEAQEGKIHARSITLSSERLGLIARFDLLEGDGQQATPVDYKRGRLPDTLEGSWEPDRVQVCVQALILRENGYDCTEACLYYADSRERVRVPIDGALVARTLALLDEAREAAEGGVILAPLTDSPKCPRCSLVGICLPDEVHYLISRQEWRSPGDQGSRQGGPGGSSSGRLPTLSVRQRPGEHPGPEGVDRPGCAGLLFHLWRLVLRHGDRSLPQKCRTAARPVCRCGR